MKRVSFLFLSFLYYIRGGILFFTFCVGQDLFISEVFVDGTDEWIELSNYGGEHFQGEITLEGVKSSPVVIGVNISAGSAVLLGDKMDMVTQPMEKIPDLGFSLPDTNAVYLKLSINGQTIDIFDVDQGDVEAINNTKTSLEKECRQTICLYKPSITRISVLSGFFASPGIYIFEQEDISIEGGETQSGTGSSSSGHISTGSFMSTGSLGSGGFATTGNTTLGSGDSHVSTGVIFGTGENSTTTGQTMTGDITTISGSIGTGTTTIGSGQDNETTNPQDIQRGDIRIVEIHAHDTEVLDEYIIIESSISYTGPLHLVGLGQGGAEKIANISLSPGDRLIITDDTSNISPEQNRYTFPSITLTNGGEDLLLFIDDILVDSVNYTMTEKGQVSIYTETIGGVRQFMTHISSSVMLTQSGDISCDIKAEPFSIDENGGILYTFSLANTDAVYCSPRYTAEWEIDGSLYGGCSLTISLSSGHHIIDARLSSQDSPLCTSSLEIYNYLGPKTGTGSTCQATGEILSGALVQIEEIYPRDTDQFSEYIELISLQDYEGEISIGGLGQGGANKTIEISVKKGERFIISDGTGLLSQDTKTYIIPTLSLTNSGEELLIYGQNGQVVDKAVYPEGSEGNSWYYTASSGALDEYFTSKIPTPGFTYDQVAYLLETDKEEDATSCAIKLQHTKPFFVGNKINLIAQIKDKYIQNSSKTYTCERSFPGSSYVFYEGCNPTYYDYVDAGIHTIHLRIMHTSTKEVCETSLDINYPDKSTTTTSSAGKDTYYQGLYKKRKGRFETLKKETTSLGYSVSTSGYITTALLDTGGEGEIVSGVISIERVLPNPMGSDTDAEQLMLKNHTDTAISLGGYKIYNGTSRKKLPELTLVPHETTTIVGSLGLTNRASCIQVQHEDITYDIFCYPQAGDDEWFDTSLAGLEKQTSVGVNNLKDMKLSLEKDRVCMLFNKESVLCKALKYHEDEIKIWKKDAKKYTTATKHLDQEKERANNRRAKYKDQVAKRKRDEEYLKGRIAKEKSNANLYRTQARIHSDFANLMIKELQLNWSPVFYTSNLADYTYAYRDLVRMVKSNTYMYNYHGLKLPVEQVEAILNLEHQEKLPLVETDISTVYEKVIRQTQGTLASFQQNLTKQRGAEIRISKTH